MSNEVTTTQNTQATPAAMEQRTAKQLFALPQVMGRFAELFAGDKSKATSFITNTLSVVNNNALLSKAEPQTILSAALLAAAINLPITQGLGQAAIVPFYNSKTGRVEAQFQIMTRGYIQLAQRTGRIARLTVNAVYEGEIEVNRFTDEYKFHAPTSDKIVGYLAYLRLVDGFEKFLYMSIEELNGHAQKYSQTAKKGYGLWMDNFNAMAEKTVLKLLLMKWAPLATSDTLARAGQMDEAVIRTQTGADGEEELIPDYVDNTPAEYATEVTAEETAEKPRPTNDAEAVKAAMKKSVK